MSKSTWIGLKIVHYGLDEQTPLDEIPSEFLAVCICTVCGSLYAKQFEFQHQAGCMVRKGGEFPL